jgi:hypothetical protein
MLMPAKYTRFWYLVNLICGGYIYICIYNDMIIFFYLTILVSFVSFIFEQLCRLHDLWFAHRVDGN